MIGIRALGVQEVCSQIPTAIRFLYCPARRPHLGNVPKDDHESRQEGQEVIDIDL